MQMGVPLVLYLYKTLMLIQMFSVITRTPHILLNLLLSPTGFSLNGHFTLKEQVIISSTQLRYSLDGHTYGGHDRLRSCLGKFFLKFVVSTGESHKIYSHKFVQRRLQGSITRYVWECLDTFCYVYHHQSDLSFYQRTSILFHQARCIAPPWQHCNDLYQL